MKKIYALVICIVFSNFTKAQEVDMPIDKLKSLLCRKWIEYGLILGDKKIEYGTDNKPQYYVFKNDFTFLFYTNVSKDPIVGNWKYLPEEKTIKFGAKGKFDKVYSVSETELRTEITVAKGTPRTFIILKPSN